MEVEGGVRIVEEGEERLLPGSHWGHGIVLLDRDREVIRPLLWAQFAAPSEEEEFGHSFWSPWNLLLNNLLRGFFYGRTYIRMFGLGAYAGYRVANVPFVNLRMEAIIGELNYKCIFFSLFLFVRIINKK